MSENLIISVAKTDNDFKELFEVRRKVFVEEQNVSEDEEYDDFENSSTHLVARINNQCVGTMRFRTTENGTKLERFAVLKEYRHSGVGKSLLLESLKKVSKDKLIYLHAQIQVVNFYGRYGFETLGDIFYEANIPHKKMVFKTS